MYGQIILTYKQCPQWNDSHSLSFQVRFRSVLHLFAPIEDSKCDPVELINFYPGEGGFH